MPWLPINGGPLEGGQSVATNTITRDGGQLEHMEKVNISDKGTDTDANVTAGGTAGANGLAIQPVDNCLPFPVSNAPWQYTDIASIGSTEISGAKVYAGIKNLDQTPVNGNLTVEDLGTGDMLFNESGFSSYGDWSDVGTAVEGLVINLQNAPAQYGVLVRWR